MSTIDPVPTAEILFPEGPEKQESKWRRYFHHGENAVVTLALAALVVLPLAESVLRKTLHLGISGSTALVQHFTLILGMIGGVIAARENRLMPLSTLGTLLKGKKKTAALIFCGACSASVGCSALLGELAVCAFGKTCGEDPGLWHSRLVRAIGHALGLCLADGLPAVARRQGVGWGG